MALTDELGDKQAEVLRRSLAEFLFTEASRGSSVIEATKVVESSADRGDFKSILYGDTSSREPNKVVSFTFRDAAADTVFASPRYCDCCLYRQVGDRNNAGSCRGVEDAMV
jgi:hypothetical protein